VRRFPAAFVFGFPSPHAKAKTKKQKRRESAALQKAAIR
jgi:hypothetical protein